ncbi:MAG: family 78 glycoside hydrolase catalytic domain, partial [Eubacteriales bacterium]
MKFTKRAVALVLSLVMVASLSAVLASADYSFVKNGAELEVADGVVHTPYTITSDYNGKTSVDAHALTFNPDDGYMPIVFSAYAGWCSTLGKQYEQATGSRYGYDVVAIINGSYFSMADGTLVGITISDSRVACAHVGWSGDLVTFGSDGSIRVVRSQLDYKLYINGEFVTQGPAPGYPFHYYYNEIDVTKFLVPGENTIAVHTYYQGLLNRVWVSADLRHGLVLDLYADGNKLCESDESWKCAYHTGYTACGKFGYDTAYAENYDAGSPEYAFALPAFDDSAWEYAKFKTADDHELFLQPTQQLDIYDVKPASLTKTAAGYMADFGFEAVGYLKFAATGKKGDVIVMHYAEELADDGSLRWKMRCNCDYEEKFTLSGREGDVLSQYDYKAFRYAELILPEGVTVDPESLVFTVRHYPFKEVKHYTGKNERLAAIYKLCSDTVKYGVQECFVDCPTREKGQYLGDVTIAGIASAALTGDPAMMKKALENYTQSSFICKGLMTVAPASLMQEIADYSLQFPFQVLWLYRYTGDLAFLRQMYP